MPLEQILQGAIVIPLLFQINLPTLGGQLPHNLGNLNTNSCRNQQNQGNQRIDGATNHHSINENPQNLLDETHERWQVILLQGIQVVGLVGNVLRHRFLLEIMVSQLQKRLKPVIFKMGRKEDCLLPIQTHLDIVATQIAQHR